MIAAQHPCPNPRQSPKCLGTCLAPLCRTCASIEAGRRKRGLDTSSLLRPADVPKRYYHPAPTPETLNARQKIINAAASSALRDAIAGILDGAIGVHDGHLVIGDIRIPLGGVKVSAGEWAIWREVVADNVATEMGRVFSQVLIKPLARKPLFKTQSPNDPEDAFRLMAFKAYFGDEQGNGPYGSIGDKKLRFALALLASAQDVPAGQQHVVNRWLSGKHNRACRRVVGRRKKAPIVAEEES